MGARDDNGGGRDSNEGNKAIERDGKVLCAPWRLSGLDQLPVVNMPRQEERGLRHMGRLYRPVIIATLLARDTPFGWLKRVVGALIAEVTTMLLALSGGNDQLLFFALLGDDDRSDLRGPDGAASGTGASDPESENNGGNAAVPPVLMYVPNIKDDFAGTFIEIYRSVPSEARAGDSEAGGDSTDRIGGGDDDAALLPTRPCPPPTVHAFQICGDSEAGGDSTDRIGGGDDDAALLPTRPCPPPTVHAFQICVVERSAQRRLVYTSARSHALASLAPHHSATMRHETPRRVRFATGDRVPAGDMFGDADTSQRLLEVGGAEHICDASLSVRRTRSAARTHAESTADDNMDDAFATSGNKTAQVRGGLLVAELADDRWSQWGFEYYVNPASLVGLLPEVLLERYVFWRTGTNLVRGYALPEAVGSQLLVRLHRRATSASCQLAGENDHNGHSGDDDGDQVGADLVVADVRRVSDSLSAGELARANYGGEQNAGDAGDLVVGANVKVMDNVDEFRATFKFAWVQGWGESLETLCGKIGTISKENKRHKNSAKGGLWELKFSDGSNTSM